MAVRTSPRLAALPPETFRAKVAHLTVASCLVLCGSLFIVSSWDEVNCVAGEVTSSGPCGVALVWGGTLLAVGIFLLFIGGIVLFRAARRHVDPDGGDGWRVGQAIVVMICGVLLGLLIPRYECPPGTTLSPVFKFCVNHDVVYPAPSPGMPWKLAAVGIGVAIGVVMLRWRSMPIWLATAIVAAASIGTALFAVYQATGIPGFRAVAPASAVLVTRVISPAAAGAGGSPLGSRPHEGRRTVIRD
ncbi:MAG TPA: hypothetical protein VJ736_08500 [Actinomycetota bacterium]|nr:hypothetical protein [Actinomycetota bacterium]